MDFFLSNYKGIAIGIPDDLTNQRSLSVPCFHMFGEDLDICQTMIESPSRIPSDGTGILIRKITWRVELDKR